MGNQTNKPKFIIVDSEEASDFDKLASLLIENNPVCAIGIAGELTGSLKLMAYNLEFWQRAGVHFNGNKEHMIIHIVAVRYASDGDPQKLLRARVAADYELFNRWTSAGFNTRLAKSPYASKAFNQFYSEKLEDIEYVIFLASTDPAHDMLFQQKPKKKHE